MRSPPFLVKYLHVLLIDSTSFWSPEDLCISKELCLCCSLVLLHQVDLLQLRVSAILGARA